MTVDQYAAHCFICDATRDDDIHEAISRGWGFAPVLGIAACPAHSITAHRVALTRMVQHPVRRLELHCVGCPEIPQRDIRE